VQTILHADMDAFYASIEQRDDPSLRGRPVVVGGAPPRGVVTAASYEARVFGVHSAMPSAQAQKLCPQAIFVRGDMAKYQRASRRIFEVFRRFTPDVEGISLDEAFLDLTGSERLLGPAAKVATELRAAVRDETDLPVSVGIAPVKMVAKIASALAKPDGQLEVRLAELRAFLDPLPVSRIWGVGPVATRRLARRGIQTIGDLVRTPEAELRAALGSWGLAVARLARGEDAREVTPYREARSYGEENTFASDVADGARLRVAIRAHAEAVARRLRHDELRGRGVTLKIKLARPLGGGKFPLLTRSLVLPHATDDGAIIADAAVQLLLRAGLTEPVRLIGVSVQRIESAAVEQLSFLPAPAEDPRRRGLNRAVDAIHDRFGRSALQRGGEPVERAGLSLQIKPGED
jgi:DNA polymerase-4